MKPRRRGSPSGLVAAAAQAACLLDVMTPKPGNVSRGHDLPGLTYRDLVLSASAIGPPFRRYARGRVGRLILAAIRSTRLHVSTNTNLGIVLLLAPLARAAREPGPGSLRARLRRVLGRLSVEDAADAYQAIRLARPGGLGKVAAQDVADRPTVTLLESMRLAAEFDAVAREYSTAFRTTFRLGLPTMRALRRSDVSLSDAIAQTYLTILASRPDTLIARRHGLKTARAVRRRAHQVLISGGLLTPRGRAAAGRLDRRLRRARPPLNPGATADLTAAALFVWLLESKAVLGSLGGSVRSRRAPRPGSGRPSERPPRPGPRRG